MQANIYDGHSWKPCTLQDAAAALKDTSLSWIDIRLDSVKDPQAPAMLTALGVDATTTLAALAHGQGTDFTVTNTQIQGAAWMAGEKGQPPVAGRFASDSRRLVTVRIAGDAAFADVQRLLSSRADIAVKEPSRLLGFVLQAMQTTIQEAITNLSIEVGLLDLDVISTMKPDPTQFERLFGLRTAFLPFVSRFPAYVVNVNTALMDPDTITVTDSAGIAELQRFATFSESTDGILNSLISAVRSTVQDMQGQVANWQGQRINQLTVVTFIFLPITFLTGYFGMNFNWLDNGITGASAYIALGIILPVLMVGFCILFLTRRGFQVSLGQRIDQGTAAKPSKGSQNGTS